MQHMGDLSFRVGQIDQRVTQIETTIGRAKHWSMRLAIMFALWLAALIGNLNAEQMAKLIAAVLKG